MEEAPSAGDGLMAPSETNACDVDGAPALQPQLVISNEGVKEECYDACTDDECHATRMVVSAIKKEEDVDTDDEESCEDETPAKNATAPYYDQNDHQMERHSYSLPSSPSRVRGGSSKLFQERLAEQGI